MTTGKDDDAFWYSSETRSFCFENNEVDQLFGVSKNDTEKLWAGISKTSISESNLKSGDDFQTTKPLLSIISEKTLSRILAVTESKLQNVDSETAVVQPDITLRRILFGQPYSLEQYSSLASKTTLLDAAILSGDGNAILIIVLFLTKTLKRSLVQRLLADRPDAVNVYIHYLFIRLQTNEITDILNMLGHSSTAAMKNLHIIIKNVRDPNTLLQKLHNCYKVQILPDCKEATFLHSYIKLLEWQIMIKQKKDNEGLALNSSVLESLHYACKYHCSTPDNFVVISPTTLSREHDISPRLYQKVALQVKATCGAWDDIDRLLLTKGMLGNTKLQTCLYIEDVLKVLHKHNASHAVLEKYLKFVDNLEKRLELAKKLSCHTTAIDIFVQQGDRAILVDYKAKLQPQSEEYFYAENALRLPHVKWKS
ncbi:PREDICTED: spermatogenesis-defective protein 39 homolog [Dinoponera quadriceps]|uniref:Spermatogenesis-defective protein 39 homolog n=1 Tax=Dinoponera quadriceps TaxID=609295 RepID=A0A6P3YF59_DINQU|nr:PREDICTED: spermatogenesis-defective protein 39 homolog [Dinoponera quadriceps]